MARILGSTASESKPPVNSDGAVQTLAPTMIDGLQDMTYVRPNKSEGYTPAASIGVVYPAAPPQAMRIGRVRLRLPKSVQNLKAQSPSGFVFNKLHIVPNPIDLGIVAGVTITDITMWAPYERPVTLDSITHNGDSGVSLDLGLTLPMTLKDFSRYEGQVTTLPTGNDVIAADFVFSINGSDAATLDIIGLRSLFYGFKHNWTETTTELYQWQTSVVSSSTGAEFRAALRAYPRVSFSQSTLLDTVEASQVYKNRVFGWFGKNFAVPLWQYQVKLLSSASANTFTLTFDNSGMNLKAGGRLVLLRDWDDYELVQIQTVNDTESVQVFSPLNSTWVDTLTRVVPVMAAGLHQRIAMDGITDRADKAMGATFDLSAVDAPMYAPVDSGLIATYQGDLVLPFKPDFSDNRTGGFSKPLVRKTDYLASAPMYFDDSEYTQEDASLLIKFFSPADILLFREFLYKVGGRHKAFWCPSYTQDFTITDNVADNSGSILVADNEYLTLVNVNDARRDLYIELWDGTIYTRRILTVVAAPDDRLSLALDTPIPDLFLPTDVKYCSYNKRYRLDNDTLTLTHSAVGLGSCTLPVVTLRS